MLAVRIVVCRGGIEGATPCHYEAEVQRIERRDTGDDEQLPRPKIVPIFLPIAQSSIECFYLSLNRCFI